jgi:hypothetical protein
MSHYLSEVAFDANEHQPHLPRCKPRPRLVVPLEKARRYAEECFHAGTLAALDVVFLHDHATAAAEIVNATDHEALLKWAIKDGYHNLGKLKHVIRQQNARANRRRADSTEG